jgi:hypothetical protein
MGFTTHYGFQKNPFSLFCYVSQGGYYKTENLSNITLNPA